MKQLTIDLPDYLGLIARETIRFLATKIWFIEKLHVNNQMAHNSSKTGRVSLPFEKVNREINIPGTYTWPLAPIIRKIECC